MSKETIEDDIQEQKPIDTAQGEDDSPSLIEIIKEQATEEDINPKKSSLSLRKIIGGEILTTNAVRRQIWVVLLITLFLIIYIAEGYSYKRYIVDIDKLTKEIKTAKYSALSKKSDLTEHTRESKIIELLKTNKDSLLKRADHPAYIIEIPE